jgi:hypothetical protein
MKFYLQLLACGTNLEKEISARRAVMQAFLGVCLFEEKRCPDLKNVIY